MKLVKYLFVVMLAFSFSSATAQLQKRYPFSMPSANASGMVNFMETPTSLFTGMPQIGLPLFTVQEGDLSLSVSLSYHAAGVKPDVHPGWVGSGWSLQAGGLITRSVNGLPDEYNDLQTGYYLYKLAGTDWTSSTALKAFVDNGDDVAPDEFNFNVDGISGMFVMDHLGNWQVKCDQDVKVVFNPSTDFSLPFMTTPPPNANGFTAYYRCFGKFTLIGPDGTKYVFGGVNSAIDFSTDFFNQNSSNWTATAWYLTQVISVDNLHVINLTYERDQYTNNMHREYYQNRNTITKTGAEVCKTASDDKLITSLIGGNLISSVYLTSIESSKEKLQFNRSTTTELRYPQSLYDLNYESYTKKLNPLSSPQEEYLKPGEVDTTTYKFLPLLRQNGLTRYPDILANLQWKKLNSITYTDKYTNQIIKQFDFNYSNSANKRLTLLSLKESNPTGASTDTIPRHQFYYDQSSPIAEYLSQTSTDDWGYNKSPQTQPMTIDNFYKDRLPEPSYTVAGTLRKIIFPTGGYKLFYFENNSYSSFVKTDHTSLTNTATTLAGGLRIKAIFDYDPLTKTLKSKRYFYHKNFTSANQNNTVSSGVISAIPLHRWSTSGHTLPSGDQLASSLTYRNTILPMSENADGSQIGYSEVTEVSDDNGYTVSKFTNFDDGHVDEPVINSLFPDKSILNNFSSLAVERGKLKYTAIYNSGGKRLKSTTISYAPLRNEKTYVRATDVKKYQVCNFATTGSLTGPYVYEGGAYKIYTYSYLPTTAVDSLFDGVNPVVLTSNSYYDNNLNKINTRSEIIRTDGQKITQLSLYPQDYLAGTAFIDSMVNKNMLAIPIETVKYLTDPSTGNVSILEGALNTYKSTNAFLKDTDNELELIAPLSLSSFKFSGSSTGALPYNTAKAAFSKDPQYKTKTSYQYDAAFNLKQVDQTDGPSSAILWGFSSKLPVAQAINAKATEVYYNGFEEDVSGTSSDSKTGLKSKLLGGGTFALPTMPALASGQSYLLTFWYKNTGGTWTYSINAYTTLPSAISGYNLIDEVRIFPQNGQLTTTAYLTPLGQVATKTDESGKTIRYEYDGLQRVKLLRDDNLNILEDYAYTYPVIQPIVENFFYNVAKSATFQKTGCGAGLIGESVIYTVSAGTYVSSVSQAKADSLAQNDVNLNGQAYANSKGKCFYASVQKSGTFYKSGCYPQQPYPYVVTIPAGAFTSEISQVDADNQAQAEVNNRGSYVDQKGSCYSPKATVSFLNSYSAPGAEPRVTITLQNLSTGTSYSSGTLLRGTSSSVVVPAGNYSITTTIVGSYSSLQLLKNGVLFDCKSNVVGSGNFANLTLVNNDSITFHMSPSSCPAPE